jgi:hypothetical protein
MWLGRLIDKARRYEAAGVAPGEMLGEYMFGDNDYMDAKLLRFLGLNDRQICEIVGSEPDDERAALRIRQHIVWRGVDADAENRFFADINPGMVEKLFLYDHSGRLVESAINTLVDSIAGDGGRQDGDVRGRHLCRAVACDPRRYANHESPKRGGLTSQAHDPLRPDHGR